MSRRLVHPGSPVSGVVQADARRNPFGKLKLEGQKPLESKPIAVENSVVERMRLAYDTFIASNTSDLFEFDLGSYRLVYDSFRAYIYDFGLTTATKKDIAEFLITMLGCLELKIGSSTSSHSELVPFYISALSNTIPDPDLSFSLVAAEPPSNFGAFNKKNITFYGTVGSGFCVNMERGVVTLHGNSEGYGLGWGMKAGKIRVFGTVDPDSLGCHSKGGEIHIDRGCASDFTFNDENSVGAKVYIAGKLIHDGGSST